MVKRPQTRQFPMPNQRMFGWLRETGRSTYCWSCESSNCTNWSLLFTTDTSCSINSASRSRCWSVFWQSDGNKQNIKTFRCEKKNKKQQKNKTNIIQLKRSLGFFNWPSISNSALNSLCSMSWLLSRSSSFLLRYAQGKEKSSKTSKRKYDLRLELHERQFNYYFFTRILKWGYRA